MGPAAASSVAEDVYRSALLGVVGGPVFLSAAGMGEQVLVGFVVLAVVLSCISIWRASTCLREARTHKAEAEARLDSAAEVLSKARALANDDE